MKLPRQWVGSVGVIIMILGVMISDRTGFLTMPRFLFQLEGALRTVPKDARIEDERAALLAELSTLQALRKENDELRELLRYTRTSPYQLTVATVISRDPLNMSLLHIDRGTDDGVAVGQPVIVGRGIMVGKVIRASPKNALFALTTSDVSRIAVAAMNEDEVMGILKGHLGSAITLEYVLKDLTIKVGDLVVTSGLDARIPRGLLLGTVVNVSGNEDELFLSAEVQPVIDFNRLHTVAVLKNV